MNKVKILILSLLAIYNLTSCENEELSNQNSVLRFFVQSDGTIYEGTLDSGSNTINISVPFNSNLEALVTQITVSEGATISPKSGASQNYETPVSFTVTAENGETRSYDVVISVNPNTENIITEFTFPNGDDPIKGNVDHTNNLISILVPFRYDFTAIHPEIEISENATISPSDAEEQNFENDISYTITAENGESRTYLTSVERKPNDENFISSVTLSSENIEGFIDNESKSVLLEVPNSLDISQVELQISISENATSVPSTNNIVDLSSSSEIIVTAENGDVNTYSISTYTVNQLNNPTGENNGSGWVFDGNTGVESTSEHGNVFFVIADDGDLSPNINQTMTFPRDYSEKYVLFIGNLTTEKAVQGSITRHPYLWAYQIGDFLPEDWIYMQGMSHREDTNVWEIVWGVHPLLPNVEGSHFKMAQARQNGDPYDGTKSTYRDIEVRLFESSLDAELYVRKIYSPRKL